MLSFAPDFIDPDMPRTVYYERFVAALRAHPGYNDSPATADILFPAEDTAVETNWPRYARPETAFTRGGFDLSRHIRYLDRISKSHRRLCVINMHPFIRAPLLMSANPNIIVADVNLLLWERLMNPRTISMPALPVTVGRFDAVEKTILAGFRGVDSHPCRRELAALHDGATILAEIVERQNHIGRLDAISGAVDAAYVSLMARSIFAFVPRGDAEFSYRLLEAMSFGCIPVIVADGLVLPFDRSIPWPEISLHMPETRVAQLPTILSHLAPDRIAAMQHGVRATYARHFANMSGIVQTYLAEIELVLSSFRP
jgi:hypothetical protein